MSARLTYTKEFFGLVSEALNDEGIFVTRSFTDDQINCLTSNTFPFTGNIQERGLASVIIGSKKPMNSDSLVSHKDECQNVENPNLSKLFWGQGLYEKNPKKRAILESIAESRILIYPQTGVLKDGAHAIKKAVDLFVKKYHKDIISFDSNSSDVFAQYLYRALSINSRHKKAFSIDPYIAKDIKLNERSSSLKTSCSFRKAYKTKFSEIPNALATKVYLALLASYEIKEDCN